MTYRGYKCLISLQDDVYIIKNIFPVIFYFYHKDIGIALEYWKQEVDYIIKETDASYCSVKPVNQNR